MTATHWREVITAFRNNYSNYTCQGMPPLRTLHLNGRANFQTWNHGGLLERILDGEPEGQTPSLACSSAVGRPTAWPLWGLVAASRWWRVGFDRRSSSTDGWLWWMVSLQVLQGLFEGCRHSTTGALKFVLCSGRACGGGVCPPLPSSTPLEGARVYVYVRLECGACRGAFTLVGGGVASGSNVFFLASLLPSSISSAF